MADPTPARAVLVVEDHPILRHLLVTALRDHGYPVLEAHDGLAAIHVIEQHEPAASHLGLILLDLMLPVINGLELMAALTEHLAGVPIVAMSGSLEYLEQATAAGATATLAKPFDLSTMLALVGQYCAPPES